MLRPRTRQQSSTRRDVTGSRAPANRGEAVEQNTPANRGVVEQNTPAIRRVVAGPVRVNNRNPIVVPVNKKEVREHCHEVLKRQNEVFLQESFKNFNLDMLTDMNEEWLQECGAYSESLRETIFNATQVDIDCIRNRVCTMPQTVGDRLDVKELIGCLMNAINNCDVFYLNMLYTLHNGNEKAIFEIILAEGRRRVTQANIKRANRVLRTLYSSIS